MSSGVESNTMNARKYNCLDGYNIILKVLKGNMTEDSGVPPVSEEIMKRLDNLKNYGSNYAVYNLEIDVSMLSEDQIKQIIGKNGCYFKITTEATDTDFIWHNMDRKVFEFWGPYNNIFQAVSAINYRIEKYTHPT